MPLDPEVAAYLERAARSGAPPRSAMTPAETREFYRDMAALAGPPPGIARARDLTVPSMNGGIPIRVYACSRELGLPVLLWFHGGRFFSGDLATHDPLCRIMAALSGWIVVAVDYRLAPENPFPAAVEDCFAVLQWLASHAQEIGGSSRLAVGGDSAGGNLAAVTSLLARDAGAPSLLHQVLVYPMLDATCSAESHSTVGALHGPSSEDMRRGYREYLLPGASLTDWRVSPLHASDLTGLPPALILTAEYDSLRDEGETYARRLVEAGVPVTLRRYRGAIHGFFQLGGVLSIARDANLWVARHMARLT